MSIQRQNETAEKPLLTPTEYLGEMRGAIGRNSLYGLIRAGRIRHVKVGRKILIPRSELENWLERESGRGQ